MKQALRFITAAWVLKLLAVALLFLTSCAGRVETMMYTQETLPAWILAEWENAQDEILALEPPVSHDPRSISAYSYSWVQLEKPFLYTTNTERKMLNGLYNPDTNEIIVCCGYKETVRHEAFHAILHAINDPRWRTCYPYLKPYIRR